MSSTLRRTATLSLALIAAALCSACIVLPSSTNLRTSTDAAELAKMGEQATATCGAGNVKEVSAKSFSCK